MYYNLKNEQIYHMSAEGEGAVLNIFLAGKTLPNPNYIVSQNSSSRENFDRYQFEYVVSGKGYIKSDAGLTELCAGDFFFINKSCSRTLFSDREEPMEKLFITVNGPLVDGLTAAYRMNEPVIKQRVDVKANFKEILRLLSDGSEDMAVAYEKIAVELLRIIQKLKGSTKGFADEKNSGRAEHIMSYIDRNIYRDFTLDELAGYFFLSKAQILRIFYDKYQTTPMKYATLKRVAVAAYYLGKSKMPIAAISDMLAFSDGKYFSKVFKKHVGMSPREYRKNSYITSEKTIDTLFESINK